ncbi:MAG: glycyl-radical enzyme activating protein [Bacteroidota bacterium]
MNPCLIFDVKKYAINDGPGIRITIFMKGCSLSCSWCHNPESKSSNTQKMYTESKCIGAQSCIEVCDQNALTLTPKGIVTDYELCNLCGDCAEVCPTKAIEMSGKEMTVDEVMALIKREAFIMEQSEGGVTFSGGEPLLHHQFLIAVLDECKKEGIHTCVDTTGFADTNILLDVAKRTDYFLYDLKLMDSKLHKEYTGVPNEKIIENLKTLASTGVDIDIRVPLISGVNDDDENIIQTAELVKSLPGKPKPVSILPHHNSAAKKYEKLGEAYDPGNMSEPSEQRQAEVLKIFADHGIQAKIGG